MDGEFKNKFYERLRDNGINDSLIKSLNDLIDNDDFSSENLIKLINGEFDESN